MLLALLFILSNAIIRLNLFTRCLPHRIYTTFLNSKYSQHHYLDSDISHESGQSKKPDEQPVGTWNQIYKDPSDRHFQLSIPTRIGMQNC
jgi:hypothetical protein